ncbi:MAG TPA: histidine phosphatase family protein [Acidocella sp.]|nr:histidine phosphatase family protein [Acidocella sp.]HQU03950.1 histidine phosphatase family protein [Acidocella sp.]
MHQLFLLRHAKAARPSAEISDHDRPLTQEGLRATAKLGQFMRKAGLAPDVVLVSSALRTQETLEALEAAQVWDERPNIDTIPGLYMATPMQIRDFVRELPETVRSAMVIGHNPGLHDAALGLASAAGQKPEFTQLSEGYPTASLSEFLITTQWHKVGTGTGTLQRFVRPVDLK